MQMETGASLGDWTGPVYVRRWWWCQRGWQSNTPNISSSRNQSLGVGRSLVCVTSSGDLSSFLCPEATVAAVKVPEPRSEAFLVSPFIYYVLAFFSCRPSSHS